MSGIFDKTTLEQKRQKAGEARKAWKEAVDKTIQFSKGEIKPGEGIEPEQFQSDLREKVDRAKAEYMTLANELAAHDTAVREEAELKAAEDFLNAPNPADKDTHRIGNGNGGGTRGPQFETSLEQLAYDMQRSAPASAHTHQQVKALRSYAKRYKALGLNEKARKLHSEVFSAYIRSPYKGDIASDKNYTDALKQFEAAVPKEKLAHLVTGDAGNLVPEDFINEVLRDVPGFSVFRNIARVESTSKDVLVWPEIKAASDTRADQGYTSGFTGSWKATRTTSGGGVALSTQDQPKWGRLNIQVHRWESDAVEVDMETLSDPDVNVEGILAEVIAETKSLDEDLEFLSGDGNGRPFGITADGGVRTVNSGSAAALTYGSAAGDAGMLGLWAGLRGQYRQNGTFMNNSKTFAAVLALEDTGSTLIFPPNSLPNTFFGRPVVFNEFMADVAAGAVSMIFGDFRHYIIADRMALSVMRLVERAAPNIAFLPIARVGGQVSRTNAFRTMTISA